MRLLRFATSVAVFSMFGVGCSTLVGLPPEPTLEESDASPSNDAAIDALDTSFAADGPLANDASDALDANALDANAPDSRDSTIPPDAPDAPDAADAADAAPDAHDASPLAPVDASDAADSAPVVDPEDTCNTDVINDWMQHRPAIGFTAPVTAAAYDAAILPLLESYGIPGGAVAVTRDGKLVFARGYGFADRGTFTVAHPDTMFRMASLTKQITSAAILVMVQKGLISLDDKAFPILTNLTPLPGQTLNPQLASITIRNLLQHTGGWNSLVEQDPMFQPSVIAQAAGVPGPADCETTIRYMLSRPLTYTPGTVCQYSNFGYCVLGAIVEKVTGTKFETWTDANVLAPLQATGLTVGHSLREQRLDEEAVYTDFPGSVNVPTVFPAGAPVVPAPYGGFNLEEMWADGAWVGSPVDLLRFQSGLDGRIAGIPALLTPSSITALTTDPHVPVGNDIGTSAPQAGGYFYGLGWAENSNTGNWWHSGLLPGTTAFQVRASEGQHGVAGKFGWVAMFNMRPQNSDGFVNQLDAALWNAHDAATDWSTRDYFEEYAQPFTPWMSFDEYQTKFAIQSQLGNFPTHVEGAVQEGASKFRARFAPSHGIGYYAIHNADCLTYKSNKTTLEGQGEMLVSLQSFVDRENIRRYQAVWSY